MSPQNTDKWLTLAIFLSNMPKKISYGASSRHFLFVIFLFPRWNLSENLGSNRRKLVNPVTGLINLDDLFPPDLKMLPWDHRNSHICSLFVSSSSFLPLECLYFSPLPPKLTETRSGIETEIDEGHSAQKVYLLPLIPLMAPSRPTHIRQEEDNKKKKKKSREIFIE